MLDELRLRLQAMIDDSDTIAANVAQAHAGHKAMVIAALAEVDAEIARVPTLADVKALLERII